MIMDLSGPSLRGRKSHAEAILDSAIGLGAARDLCCDYPPRACCWDDRSAKASLRRRMSLRGLGNALRGPLELSIPLPLIGIAGALVGAILAKRRR